MKKELEIPFLEIKEIIDQARNKAFTAVNAELIQLYWNIGAFISKRIATAHWGDKIIGQLADF